MLKSLQELFVAIIALKRRRKEHRKTSALAGAVTLDEDVAMVRCTGCGARLAGIWESDVSSVYCPDCMPLKTRGWL